jgi:prepilin-type N-terminal cleavage/methylation domain-containing protein
MAGLYPRSPVMRRNGFTLVETAIALVIVGLLVLIGFPKVRSGLDRNNVRSSRTEIVNMLTRARTSATLINRKTWLKIGGNRAWILARPRLTAAAGSDADTLGLVENLSTRYGTTVVTAGLDSIGFDPRGVAYGWSSASGTITVSKHGYSDVITVDAKGRVSK